MYNINAPIFDVVTISDKAYTITLLENNNDQCTADSIAKKEIEECGFRPMVRDEVAGDNSTSGEGGEDYGNDNKPITKNKKHECGLHMNKTS